MQTNRFQSSTLSIFSWRIYELKKNQSILTRLRNRMSDAMVFFRQFKKIWIIRTIKIKSFIHKYNNNSYNKLSNLLKKSCF